MERKGKRYLLITLLIGIFLLSGCDKVHFGIINASKENDQKIHSDQEINQDEKEVKIDKNDNNQEKEKNEVTSNDAPKNNETTEVPSDIKPKANIALPIYTLNSDSEIEAATAMISEDSKITPELIVNEVVESMADKSIVIGIEKISTENDAIIVSFYDDYPPLTDVGAGIETAILDAIAQSLIDNLPDYNKVIYRVEGKAYMSGHIEMDINEPYFLR